MRHLKITGIDVFLEKRRTRFHVGVLKNDHGKFVFTYDESYFKARNVIPLGPEFPLTKKQFSSNQLFSSLQDRIPSQQNPAYSEYCKLVGIDPKEKDPFVLLATIGKRGPSSFMFSPIFERKISADDLIKFREYLGLSTREFAKVFEVSQSSLNALERGRTSGKDVLKKMEILLNFPAVALDFLFINGGCLIHEKWIFASEKIKKMISRL